MRLVPTLFTLAALASCGSDPAADACLGSTASTLSGTATASVLVDDSGQRVVRVVGTARQSAGAAIRTVSVAGQPAHADDAAFNFSAWAVTLPTVLVAALPVATDGTVTLDVTAADACGDLAKIASVTVKQPSLADVRALTVELEAPGGESYLPVTRAQPGTVRLVANKEADGAEATVSVSVGTLLGGLDPAASTARVRFVAGSDGTARALLQLVATQSGTLLVTAHAGAQLATSTIVAAGAPVFSPSSARFQSGTTLDVSVRSPGRIASCTLEASGGVTVRQDGAARTGTFDPRAEPAASVPFEIEVPADDGPFTLDLRCEDAFGQSASFTAEG